MNSVDKITLVMNYLINIRHFSTNVGKDFNEEFSKTDVSRSESFYLIFLNENKDGLTLSELSSLTKVNKSLTTRIVKKLIDKEYIYKDIDDLTSRNYKIKLTSKGVEKAKKLDALLIKKYDSFVSCYTEEEMQLINKAFKILLEKFEEK